MFSWPLLQNQKMLKGKETFGRFTIANEGVGRRNKDYSRKPVCVKKGSCWPAVSASAVDWNP
jgi:hypothetical protein